MTRISREAMLMKMAEAAAGRSTCSRAQVGVIVAVESRPLVSGYNGAPTGMPHCNHTCDCYPDTVIGYKRTDSGEVFVDPPIEVPWHSEVHEANCRSQLPCEIAVHAEANAIAFAAKHGVCLLGSSLFVTVEPCRNCCMLIINAGIVEVVYAASYRDHTGTMLLKDAGVKVWSTILQ